MNTNLSLGIISFMVWSAFSTWYYVNYIKDFSEQNKIIVKEKILKSESTPSKIDSAARLTEGISREKSIQDEINLTKNFQFRINSTELVAPGAFQSFYDSLSRTVKDAEVIVEVTGHACDLGTPEYNMDLSKARANVMADLIRDGTFEVSSVNHKGEADPLLPNTSESNRKQNRRVKLQFKTK